VKASVGEDDIEFSPLFNEFINRTFSRFGIRYIGLQREQVIAERWEAVCKVFGLRPVIATRAPSPTNNRAVANPMPLLPPVIKATLLSSFMSDSPY
jgi:hypothetical protein